MINLKFKQEFDAKNKRYYVNGLQTVIHCHHYSTLLTQLAFDAKKFGGIEALLDSSEKIFYKVFQEYFKENKIQTLEDKVSVIEQYFSFLGLGKIKFFIKEQKAEITKSHIDEGWLIKWGLNDQPVNIIGQGFIAAAFSAATESSIDTVFVTEVESIVCGSKSSIFMIQKKQGRD